MSDTTPQRDCPKCGEPGMIFYPAEGPDEPDVFSCPDCGYEVHTTISPNQTRKVTP